MKLEIFLLSLIALQASVAEAVISGDCSVLKTPTIETDPYYHVNPNTSCKLNFSLPGLPSMTAGQRGGGVYSHASCGALLNAAQDALNEVQSDLQKEINSIDPIVSKTVSGVVNSSIYQSAINDSSGGSQAGQDLQGVINNGYNVQFKPSTNVVTPKPPTTIAEPQKSLAEEKVNGALQKPRQEAANDGTPTKSPVTPPPVKSSKGYNMDSWFTK